MPKSRAVVQPGLAHVVVCGGTPAQWQDMSAGDWQDRVNAVARAAAAEGATWVTVVPRHGKALAGQALEDMHARILEVPGMTKVVVAHGSRFVWSRGSGPTVIIETQVDGHSRFASTIEGLRTSGVDPESVDEALVSAAVLAPATDEPDLVVVLGPADRIPESMVWELAYSELVFIDLEWDSFESSHLELAIDDFNRRHRRFGGLDS